MAVEIKEIVQESVKTATAPQTALYAATGTEAEAKAFVYNHESGNRSDAINASSGACGIGQALPCSKLPCSLQDYTCQDNWFTGYMEQRYGTWQAAKAYWQCIGQCTNKYGTIYKSHTWW